MMIRIKKEKDLSNLDATVYFKIDGGTIRYKTFVRKNNIILVEDSFMDILKLYIDTNDIDVSTIKIEE